MDGLVVGVSNRVAYIEGFFRPGALLIGEGGSKMLVVSRRKAFPPSYVNVLRMAVDEPIEPIAPVATAKALVVSDEVPEPGERVREAAWPEGRGILAPDGPANLLSAEVPHISVIASTGMGKTTLVKMLVGQAAAAGYRVVVFDMHDEYCGAVEAVGGACMPPVLPLCDMSDHELLVATGLARVSTSPIRMMKYIRLMVDGACRLAEGDGDLARALEACSEALAMLDKINVDLKRLDGGGSGDSPFAACAKAVRDAVGPAAFNTIRSVVRGDEDRVGAASMYLSWAANSAKLVKRLDLPKAVAFNMLEFKSLFAMSDAALASIAYIMRKVVEAREGTLLVVEEAPKLMADEVASRNLELFLAQARKFGATVVMVSQAPHDLIQNTRLVVGRVNNSTWARKLAELAPQMPGELARLLPQLRRGEFIYMDGRDVVPLKVVP
jgi:energy-coupling factor transporter ATP-binding protein EcfA2